MGVVDGLIVLEEVFDENGKYMGRIAVDKEILLKKVSELHPNDDTIPEQFKNMTLIAWIKADIEDRLGYKKYRGKLKEAGFDV